LLPTYDTSNELLEQFVSSVDQEFDYIHKDPLLLNSTNNSNSLTKIKFSQMSQIEKRERIKNTSIIISNILSSSSNLKELIPKQIMIITTDDAILNASKDLGFFTLKYREPQGLYGQCTTDFSATSAIEVQDALEELNGVALRSSAFSHRSI
jgi:hypothetical protein